ncbi:hypothetical protein [Halorubrum sp. DM2]|uniref:hypothetical protein n=1 Tax=Halorubrum sp. DM2 TaxID=2527867 RepID=UPI0024B6692C|nr:hypothetical protein [Halorubrum sp. DM2]
MPSGLFGFSLRDIYSRVIPGAVGSIIVAGPYMLYGYYETNRSLPQNVASDITVIVPVLLLVWFGFGEAIRYFRRANGGVPREFREQYQYYHPQTNNSYLIESLLMKLKISSWDTPDMVWTDQCQFFWDDVAERFDLDTRKSGHIQVYKILQKDLRGDLSVDTLRHKSLYELSRNIRMSIIISYVLLAIIIIQQYASGSAVLSYSMLWIVISTIIITAASQIYKIIFVGLVHEYINDLLTEYYIKYISNDVS